MQEMQYLDISIGQIGVGVGIGNVKMCEGCGEASVHEMQCFALLLPSIFPPLGNH